MSKLDFCIVAAVLVVVWLVLLRFTWSSSGKAWCASCGAECEPHRQLCEGCLRIERAKQRGKDGEV